MWPRARAPAVSSASAGNNGAYENGKCADFLLFAFKCKELDSIRIKDINHKILAHACAHEGGGESGVVPAKFKLLNFASAGENNYAYILAQCIIHYRDSVQYSHFKGEPKYACGLYPLSLNMWSFSVNYSG